jgi:hypothetical protein
VSLIAEKIQVAERSRPLARNGMRLAVSLKQLIGNQLVYSRQSFSKPSVSCYLWLFRDGRRRAKSSQELN